MIDRPLSLLKMSGISKTFGATAALTKATLEVHAGEVHALIGQNGAGKSTLIKILTGYYRRDKGDITFAGDAFDASSPMDAQHKGISTIYQEINLVPMRSVTENICLGREKYQFGFLDWPAMHADAERLLGRFNMDIDVRRPLSGFNTATQQMVAIARAIGFDAKLVIMDEPTSSLDAQETEVLFAVIRQLKSEGVAVIFVSHKLDELYSVCDRVTIMRDGKTVLDSDMAAISKVQLVSSMIGRDLTSSGGHATGFGDIHQHKSGDMLFQATELADGGLVKNVSFEVRKGEITALAGLLGAGRTETARVVFGSVRPVKGTMTFDSNDYDPRSPAEAIANGIGFCTEDRKTEGIVPDMSVGENMMLALMPRLTRAGVVDREKQDEIVTRYINRIGIKCSGPDQKISELSGGNQQKVLLARWLATDPRLVILDEPTRGIDVGAKSEIQRLIRELADDGLAVLMISSEIEEVVEGADRAVVLRDGVNVAEINHAALSEHAMIHAMAEGAADV